MVRALNGGKGLARGLTVDVEAHRGQTNKEGVEHGREVQREGLGEGRKDLDQAEDDLGEGGLTWH